MARVIAALDSSTTQQQQQHAAQAGQRHRHSNGRGDHGQDMQQPVVVVMGVSGTGKSTVAGLLAGRLNWDLEEGDDLHPEENVAKMAAGIPLTDEDRWPWLDTVASWIREHELAGRPGVITCSALKRPYRDRLRGPHVVFMHLVGTAELVGKRLTKRIDHYMPPSLLQSQMDTLEPPGPDENVC